MKDRSYHFILGIHHEELHDSFERVPKSRHEIENFAAHKLGLYDATFAKMFHEKWSNPDAEQRFRSACYDYDPQDIPLIFFPNDQPQDEFDLYTQLSPSLPFAHTFGYAIAPVRSGEFVSLKNPTFESLIQHPAEVPHDALYLPHQMQNEFHHLKAFDHSEIAHPFDLTVYHGNRKVYTKEEIAEFERKLTA